MMVTSIDLLFRILAFCIAVSLASCKETQQWQVDSESSISSLGNSLLQTKQTLSVQDAKSTSNQVSIKLRYKQKSCKTQSTQKLTAGGKTITSPQACAQAASLNPACSNNLIMIPVSQGHASKWGCRCCKAVWGPDVKSHKLWNVWKISKGDGQSLKKKAAEKAAKAKKVAAEKAAKLKTVAAEKATKAKAAAGKAEKSVKEKAEELKREKAAKAVTKKAEELKKERATKAVTKKAEEEEDPENRPGTGPPSTWPAQNAAACSQTNKQKSMYGEYQFDPPLSTKGSTDISMSVIWEDWTSASWRGTKGGVYASWPFKTGKGSVKGPSGYFGAQLKAKSSFIFSVWDGNRFTGSGHNKKFIKSDQLVWPLNANCKRNCQDCGLHELRKYKQAGFTTGTKCMTEYLPMNKLGRFDLRIHRVKASMTINTAQYGGMPKGHGMIGEHNRQVTGSRWRVTATNAATQQEIEVADLLLEGGEEIVRITTFDEMLGCNKCNDAYHRDTRLGPFLHDADGSIRKPISAKRIHKGPTTCRKYRATGSKEDSSITFEGGPGAEPNFDLQGTSKHFEMW
eukprot:gnl/MRDRNA2_/MRDRNA2_92968_c0_seq1.p1 gnl/MRDRNA2_/MRDRNA2_92968_c0~~gnl/MRDRNA2_/MRDRNA2_92968_c0_seq1.p1  ORF type:complete len:568 (+),score=122.23 gnl/MRDRNA2_/MRDRNA2_92968_c0_seq1:81-1784(+)